FRSVIRPPRGRRSRASQHSRCGAPSRYRSGEAGMPVPSPDCRRRCDPDRHCLGCRISSHFASPPDHCAGGSENKVAREDRMSGNVTEVLAGFAASLRYDDLPGHVRDHCKNVLLDTVACAVAGHRGEETAQLAALAASLAQSSESSVIGGDRLSLAGATMLNGYLVTAVTMCD